LIHQEENSPESDWPDLSVSYETDQSQLLDTSDGPITRLERTAAAPRPPYPPPGYSGPPLTASNVLDEDDILPSYGINDVPVYGARGSSVKEVHQDPVYGGGQNKVYKPPASPNVKPVQAYQPPITAAPTVKYVTYTTTRARPRVTVATPPPLVAPAATYGVSAPGSLGSKKNIELLFFH
jgi:hypothetical protein